MISEATKKYELPVISEATKKHFCATVVSITYLEIRRADTLAGAMLSSRANAVCIVNWFLNTSFLFHTAEKQKAYISYNIA